MLFSLLVLHSSPEIFNQIEIGQILQPTAKQHYSMTFVPNVGRDARSVRKSKDQLELFFSVFWKSGKFLPSITTSKLFELGSSTNSQIKEDVL